MCGDRDGAPNTANQIRGEGALPDDSCRDRSRKTSAKEVYEYSRLGELCARKMSCVALHPSRWNRSMLSSMHGVGNNSDWVNTRYTTPHCSILLTPASTGTTFNTPHLMRSAVATCI